MRLSPTEHSSRAWRIHEIADGFSVEDVWSLGVIGAAEDFDRLIDHVQKALPGGPTDRTTLLRIRSAVGGWLGWDEPENGLGGRVTPLRDRLPADLVAARIPARSGAPHIFSPIYRLETEWAAELANITVHGILHLGWVEQSDGTFRGQLAVLVRPNGRFGRLYMVSIKPFRLLIYPAWIRRIERRWAP